MRCSRWRGSSPLSGSSSTRTSGSWTRALATFTRWRLPFESARTGRRSVADTSTSASACSVAATGSGTRSRRAAVSTNSRAVRDSNIASCCGTRPMRPRMREVAAGVAAEHPDRPLRRAGQPAHQAQHGRLAGAVGAEQRGDAGPDGEGDVGHGDDVAEPLRDVVDLDQRRRGDGGACRGAGQLTWSPRCAGSATRWSTAPSTTQKALPTTSGRMPASRFPGSP